ncbi:hypothetical protein LSTR_LSTR013746 [Laodelphax striatellus]|uniref:Uncharacterized protein n=1 Tax=Laodelphax striatellus TaxID=195883 RepID=A0A482WZV1_LAOST|nr:hypothetical protein LSTR_LSTR013746 [Laodelphax striatellus]
MSPLYARLNQALILSAILKYNPSPPKHRHCIIRHHLSALIHHSAARCIIQPTPRMRDRLIYFASIENNSNAVESNRARGGLIYVCFGGDTSTDRHKGALVSGIFRTLG